MTFSFIPFYRIGPIQNDYRLYVEEGGILDGHHAVPRLTDRDRTLKRQTRRKSKRVNVPTIGSPYPLTFIKTK